MNNICFGFFFPFVFLNKKKWICCKKQNISFCSCPFLLLAMLTFLHSSFKGKVARTCKYTDLESTSLMSTANLQQWCALQMLTDIITVMFLYLHILSFIITSLRSLTGYIFIHRKSYIFNQ